MINWPTWFRDVAINLVVAVLQAHGGVHVQVVHGPLPRPAQSVDPGVKHKPEGANEVVGVVANQLEGEQELRREPWSQC